MPCRVYATCFINRMRPAAVPNWSIATAARLSIDSYVPQPSSRWFWDMLNEERATLRFLERTTERNQQINLPSVTQTSYLDIRQDYNAGTYINRVMGNLHSSALPTSASFTDLIVDATLDQLLQTAINDFVSIGLEHAYSSIDVQIMDLPGSQLGYAQIQSSGDETNATIVLDDDAAGHGWLIDQTPDRDEEFTRRPNGSLVVNDPDASGRYDLLTVIRHELGHLHGFSTSFDGFTEITQRDGYGRPIIETSQGTLYLDPSGNEADALRHPNLLMAGALKPGVRKSLADIEQLALQQASVSGNGSEGFTVLGQLQGGLDFGFAPLNAILDSIVPNNQIFNGDFSVTDSDDPDFEWSTIGSVAVMEGVATIAEDVGMVSDLSQTFVMPAGLSTITFTVGGVSMDVGGTMDQNTAHPPEAFEVAIVNSLSTQSLLGEMSGLSGGDAVFSLQADGTVYFAEGVFVEGVSESGGVVDTSQPFDVSIRFPESVAGETATLMFDLIGFGDDESSVNVNDVVLKATNGWQNPFDRFDVDDSGNVSIRDVIKVISEFANPRVHDLATRELFEITDEVGPPPFYDVSGDGRLGIRDAIQVLNEYIDRLSAEPEAHDAAIESMVNDETP